MRTEDGYIIRQCLDGDSTMFGFLVDKYKRSVYALAYSKVCNFHDAQDIAQEVFIKAYRNLRTLKNWDNFMGWLSRITLNTCKNWIRSESKRPDSEFAEDQRQIILSNSYVKSYNEDKLCESVREALDSLPEVYSQVLTLRYFGGMTVKEISRFLSVSPSTIDRRISEAQARLREEILIMMNMTKERYELPSSFTFNIIEMIRNIRIQPVSPVKPLPLGLSLATGFMLLLLGFGSNINLPDSISSISTLSQSEAHRSYMEDTHVVLSDMTRLTGAFLSGGDGDGSGMSEQQNAVFMAPKGEGGKIPDMPSFQLSKGSLGNLAYSPDGKILAVTTGIGVRLYASDDFNEIGILQYDGFYPYRLTFSPDGKILAVTGDDKISLWDMQTLKQTGSLPYANIVVFSSNGRILASTEFRENMIRLWDTEKLQQTGSLTGHTDFIYCLAFCPDGRTLISAGNDKTIRLWDIQEQKQIGLFADQKDATRAIAVSPNGKTLASGGWGDNNEGILHLWNIQEQRLIGSLIGQKLAIISISFSPDSKTLVTGGWDDTMYIWDIQTQKQIGSLKGGIERNLVAFNPDGKTIASIDWQAIRFWDVQDQKQIAMIDGFSNSSASLAFSPDGEILASGENGGVRLWSAKGQNQLGFLKGHAGCIIGLNSIAFSPDGKIIASINSNEIYLFDVQKQERIGILKGHGDLISSLAFTPDSKILVSSGNVDQTVRVWDVDTQKQLAVLRNGSWAHTVAISPDGETIAAAVGGERLIRLWDTKTHKELGVLNDPAVAAFSVAFSPDGETLASCNQLGIIRIWDYKKRKLIHEFKESQAPNPLSSVIIKYSPDGKWITSVYHRNTRFWDVQEQKEITTQGQFRDLDCIDFSPNGKWMATCGWDGIIKLWEVDISVQGKAVNPMGKAIDTWGDIKNTNLFQNYPNPFNPETWIPFCISEPNDVKLKIYSSKGELVRTLDLGQRQPGEYLDRQKAAYWDGRNESGEQVASNIYFTVMEAGEFKSVRKMVMVR